jgi:hypothetical protein
MAFLSLLNGRTMNELVPIVTFRPSYMGCEHAHLGHKLIGQVAPCGGRTSPRAYALIFLPDIPKRMLAARSIDDARDIVRREVADWLDGAGLVPVATRRRA